MSNKKSKKIKKSFLAAVRVAASWTHDRDEQLFWLAPREELQQQKQPGMIQVAAAQDIVVYLAGSG